MRRLAGSSYAKVARRSIADHMNHKVCLPEAVPGTTREENIQRSREHISFSLCTVLRIRLVELV